jgi:hypothetical protein
VLSPRAWLIVLAVLVAVVLSLVLFWLGGEYSFGGYYFRALIAIAVAVVLYALLSKLRRGCS